MKKIILYVKFKGKHFHLERTLDIKGSMSQIRRSIKYKNDKRICIKTISETKPKMIRRHCISFREMQVVIVQKGHIFYSWAQGGKKDTEKRKNQKL